MISTYLGNKLLDHIAGKAAYALPGTLYLALYTAGPSAAGGGTAAAFAGYARVAVPPASWAVAAGRAASNTAAIEFPASSDATASIITHWGLFDASVAGNLLEFGALDAAITISTGDIFIFDPGTLTRTVT